MGEPPMNQPKGKGHLYISGWWCNNHLEKKILVNGKDYPIYYGT
jgi:hypothetical protein